MEKEKKTNKTADVIKRREKKSTNKKGREIVRKDIEEKIKMEE